MTRQAISLLRQIVGRIIKKMAQWFLNLGAIWIPVSMLIFFFAIEESAKKDANWLIVWATFGMGLAIGVSGCVALLKAYDRLRKREGKDQKQFDDLMEELRGFRKDMIDGGQHGSHDSK